MSERGVICFGLDESNHAGENRKGEIVVCTYSYDIEDSKKRKFPNTRNFSKLQKWLSEEGHGHRFTLLTGENYRCQSSAINLTETAPRLIEEILTDPKNPYPIPDTLKIYFDGGGFKREQREYLRDYFKELGFKQVIVDNFIKKKGSKNRKVGKGRFRKGPECPGVLYMADVLANHLHNTTTGEVLANPNFVT